MIEKEVIFKLIDKIESDTQGSSVHRYSERDEYKQIIKHCEDDENCISYVLEKFTTHKSWLMLWLIPNITGIELEKKENAGKFGALMNQLEIKLRDRKFNKI